MLRIHLRKLTHARLFWHEWTKTDGRRTVLNKQSIWDLSVGLGQMFIVGGD